MEVNNIFVGVWAQTLGSLYAAPLPKICYTEEFRTSVSS